jgi:hypothetical protein
MKRSIAFLLIILVLPLMWLACGDSGGMAGGGIGGSGVTASGLVTATGSIFVNGVQYETDTAQVTKEDDPFSGHHLTAGMLVHVNGSIDAGGRTGTARSVEVLVTLRGVIAAVGEGQLTILGQSVRVDEDTVIDYRDDILEFEDLETGDPVEVSGFVRPSGGLYAVRIEVLQQLPQNAKVTGIVEETWIDSFRIGGLVVFYPADVLSGDYVEAVGGNWNDTSLWAERVRKLNGPLDEAEAVDLEGYLAAGGFLLSPLGPVSVQSNAHTIFSGGATEDFVAGARIAAQGRMQDGIMVATTVTFTAKIKIEAAAQGAIPETGRIVLHNLPDLMVFAEAPTLFLDRRPNMPRKPQFPGILETLTGNERLWIKGRMESDGMLSATMIRVDPPPQSLGAVILTAPVEEIVGFHFEAAGLIVETLPATTYENAQGQEIDAEDFFDTLTPGTLVRVRGVSDAAIPNLIRAERVSLEE